MTCATCGQSVLPAESVRIGEYDWHTVCVDLKPDWNGILHLARFPSDGKLIPDTIMESE